MTRRKVTAMPKAALARVGSTPKDRGASQTGRAALVLREMLLEGHFQPGERIREVPLAAELGVSRIPLRLVLERLAHEGLLVVRPTRGFVVQRFSTADIYDAIELRGLLEGMAARLMAERVQSPADTAKLHALHNELVRVVRRRKLTLECLEQYMELNAKFHAEILTLSESRMLQRAMEHVCSLPFASPSAFVRRQYLAAESRELFHIAIDQHQGIVDAITNREAARAETLAREHARVARRNLESALKNGEIAKFVPGMKLIKL
ncbi:MAG: GntR family transcriptional regulator [Bryobacterales bacterium]|nr:GntR family transcriptional regulator [Bryobacterales bacterium]